MNQAVFLDRDGTINQDRGYIYKPRDIIFEDRAVEAIRLLNQARFKVIVISNQAGIAHGHFTERDVDELHSWIGDQLALQQACIDAFYYCPHHPSGQGRYRVECTCRKPSPGLLVKAAADFSINLGRSWMIGDHQSDIAAGISARVKSIFVLTGHGRQELPRIAKETPVAENLYAAVTKYIIA